MTLKIIRNLLLALGIIVIAFGVGYRVGRTQTGVPRIISPLSVAGRDVARENAVNFSQFWVVWDRLNRYYIDNKALDPVKMVDGAISGMVAALGDPYTVYLPLEQNKEAKDDLGGKFQGIGAQLGIKDKKIVVVAPLKSSPAEKSGIRSGDWIIKVDGKESAGWTLPEAVSKIRGDKGSLVVLTIMHKDASVSADVKVVRDDINVASVEWNFKNIHCNNDTINQCQIIATDCPNCQKVIYLKLSRFGDTTNDEWVKAVDEIIKQTQSLSKNSVKGIIFDLRNNPGGYLTGSVFIASEFLKSGTVVIQEKASGEKTTYNVDRTGRLFEQPLVVLINKGSASASEIVAGALLERGRAKLVGETSFGKGTIQEAQELDGGAGLHITTAKWLLPNSKWINGTGIDPDVKAINDENKPDEDVQLQKAVETLMKG